MVHASSRRVICVSESIRGKVQEEMGRRCRTSVVYYGVDPELFHPSDEAHSESLLILSVGDLLPIEGYELLLHGASSLASEFPTLHWEFIGDGPERSRLQNWLSNLKSTHVWVFLDADLANRLPQRCEDIRYSRCPAVRKACRTSIWTRWRRANRSSGAVPRGSQRLFSTAQMACLVGPNNEKELTLATAMLLRDGSLRHNIGTAARDTILERLTLAHQADSLARIYRESIA